MKFVCYKEFDDPQEPILPGIWHKGKTLPLAHVVAVAEALQPRGLSVPADLNAVMARLPGYAKALKDLEKARILDKLWPEAGVTHAAPLPRPHRILAIGRNYGEHAKETGQRSARCADCVPESVYQRDRLGAAHCFAAECRAH